MDQTEGLQKVGLPCPEPGIYRNVDNAEYHQWRWYEENGVTRECLSNSGICGARRPRSWRHFRYAQDHPEARIKQRWDHFDMGSAFHTYSLERNRFDQDVIVAAKPHRGSQKGKDAFDELVAQAGDRALITPEQFIDVQGMYESMMADPMSRPLLEQDGETELSVVTEMAGVRYRVRADKYLEAGDWTALVDLKSTTCACPYEWLKSAFKFAYHMQAGGYSSAFEDQYGKRPGSFIWIVVEKSPPYCLSVIDFDAFDMWLGLGETLSMISQYLDCEITGHWPAFGEEVTRGRLPGWARDKLERMVKRFERDIDKMQTQLEELNEQR